MVLPMENPNELGLLERSKSLSRTFVLRFLLVAVCSGWFGIAYSQDANWPEYLGGKERNLYSTLEQINRSNVSQLEVAWTYETGDADEYQANNLIVDGVLYTPTPVAQGGCTQRSHGRGTLEMGSCERKHGAWPRAAARVGLLGE